MKTFWELILRNGLHFNTEREQNEWIEQ